MQVKSKFAQKLPRVVVTAILVLFGIICLVPLFWMVSTSFKPELDVFEYPIRWIPKRWNFNTYKTVFGDALFPRYFLNSVKVTFFSVAGTLVFSSLSGYAFARMRFKGREALFLIFLCTMMIPNQVLLVPKYLLFRYLHIANTHLALILPSVFDVFSVFFFRQAFMSISMSFTEAAKIDGAGPLRIFGQIIIPMVKPTIMTITLLQFSNSWNDYINPKTYLSNDLMYTIPVGLQKFQLANSSNMSTIMAGTAVSLIPIILIFIFTQKHFVESFASSGIKG